jgi:hypothetical protein
MAGEHQERAGRRVGERIGAVAENQPGTLEALQGGERGREVGAVGEIVVKASDSDGPDLHRVVLQQADSGAGEGAPGRFGVAPMVVIAEHGDRGQPRAEPGERRHRLVVRIITCCETLVGDEVAGDEDDIRPEPVDLLDDPAHPRRRHVRPADMDVRYEHQPQRKGSGRPARGRDPDGADFRLPDRRPVAKEEKGRSRKRRDQKEALEDPPHRLTFAPAGSAHGNPGPCVPPRR